MAKKPKRQVSRGRRLSQAQRQAAPRVPATAQPAQSGTAGASRPSLSGEFNPDYTYVKQDLKKIGILAGTFVTILVILSFFLG